MHQHTSCVMYVLLLTLLSNMVLPAKFPIKSSDFGLNTEGIIKNHGYICESHHITTEDGYILTVQRIPSGFQENRRFPKMVVYIQHGALSSSADWVVLGPNRSLGFILADLGYDVWIGNSRGNSWARKHTTLNIKNDAEKFFDFSWHEMGYYDLPATIDYILDVTGEKNLTYVGHSQGGTIFFVLTTTRPEYNHKIRAAFLMAPAAFMEHRPDGVVKKWAENVYKLETLAKKFKIFEIPHIEEVRFFLQYSCDSGTICLEIINRWCGGRTSIDKKMIPVIATNTPANNGVKPLVHFGQLIRNGGFTFFDYGPVKNMILYGSNVPPSYNLSRITVPVAIYYGKGDNLVQYKDTLTLLGKIPTLIKKYLVPAKSFNHADYILARNVVKMVYNQLTRDLQTF